MFTPPFTLDRHIEELRAELHGAVDREEIRCIKLELEAALLTREDQIREAEAKG